MTGTSPNPSCRAARILACPTITPPASSASTGFGHLPPAGVGDRGNGFSSDADGSDEVVSCRLSDGWPLEQSGFELWVPPAYDTPGSHKVRCRLRAGGR